MNAHATSSTTDEGTPSAPTAAAGSHKDCVPLAPEELLYENVLALVDHPDEVRIETQLSADKKICTLIVHTNPSDRGKVIGSEGRAVRTLRDLFGRIAASRGMRIMIVVSDADDTPVEAASGDQP